MHTECGKVYVPCDCSSRYPLQKGGTMVATVTCFVNVSQSLSADSSSLSLKP